MRSVPQGLKPLATGAVYGTAEAVPLSKTAPHSLLPPSFAIGEESTALFQGVGLTVAALIEAAFETLVDGFAVLL